MIRMLHVQIRREASRASVMLAIKEMERAAKVKIVYLATLLVCVKFLDIKPKNSLFSAGGSR